MCPLLPKSCDSFGSRQNVAAAACEGYPAAGELRSYSKYGTQCDFSPSPCVRLCFALTACRLPRRWWLALLLCRLPSAVKPAAAPLPENPSEGDCPPQTASSFGDTALDSGKPGLNSLAKRKSLAAESPGIALFSQ